MVHGVLLRGELDGALRNPDKSHGGATISPIFVLGGIWLTRTPAGAATKTSLFPINHTVVVRRALLERHPWTALNLYSAFAAAKEEIASCGQSYLQWYFEAGLLDGGVARTLAEHDPLAYGFKAAKPVLATIA